MTEYTDIVEAMRLRIKEEKEKKKFTFIEASSGRYLIGRKDGSVQELNREEWLKLKG
tara:strand:- start:1160 stop:1330 length:171 start_codon:yes stop_codon:yes gene_type:complete